MKDGQQSISVNQIKVSARAGATIYHAISESVIMAFEQDEIVILRHNQKEYVIDPGAIHGFIFNASNPVEAREGWVHPSVINEEEPSPPHGYIHVREIIP